MASTDLFFDLSELTSSYRHLTDSPAPASNKPYRQTKQLRRNIHLPKPFIMLEKTTEPREDHILWTCKRLKDPAIKTYCNKLNGMLDKKCIWCKSNRDIVTIAVNRTRKDIGKIIEKDADGLDVWEYDDPSAKS
jgi:hypothetical protein